MKFSISTSDKIQDFNEKLSLEEARCIMKESSDFGAYIHHD